MCLEPKTLYWTGNLKLHFSATSFWVWMNNSVLIPHLHPQPGASSHPHDGSERLSATVPPRQPASKHLRPSQQTPAVCGGKIHFSSRSSGRSLHPTFFDSCCRFVQVVSDGFPLVQAVVPKNQNHSIMQGSDTLVRFELTRVKKSSWNSWALWSLDWCFWFKGDRELQWFDRNPQLVAVWQKHHQLLHLY